MKDLLKDLEETSDSDMESEAGEEFEREFLFRKRKHGEKERRVVFPWKGRKSTAVKNYSARKTQEREDTHSKTVCDHNKWKNTKVDAIEQFACTSRKTRAACHPSPCLPPPERLAAHAFVS